MKSSVQRTTGTTRKEDGAEEKQGKNFLKAKLRAGKAAVGTWIEMPCPDIAEQLSLMGFDLTCFRHRAWNILPPPAGTDHDAGDGE
jgi:hypothetical protein